MLVLLTVDLSVCLGVGSFISTGLTTVHCTGESKEIVI